MSREDENRYMVHACIRWWILLPSPSGEFQIKLHFCIRVLICNSRIHRIFFYKLKGKTAGSHFALHWPIEVFHRLSMYTFKLERKRKSEKHTLEGLDKRADLIFTLFHRFVPSSHEKVFSFSTWNWFNFSIWSFESCWIMLINWRLPPSIFLKFWVKLILSNTCPNMDLTTEGIVLSIIQSPLIKIRFLTIAKIKKKTTMWHVFDTESYSFYCTKKKKSKEMHT